MNSLEVIKHINTPEVSEKILRRAVALNRGGATKGSPKSQEKFDIDREVPRKEYLRAMGFSFPKWS